MVRLVQMVTAAILTHLASTAAASGRGSDTVVHDTPLWEWDDFWDWDEHAQDAVHWAAWAHDSPSVGAPKPTGGDLDDSEEDAHDWSARRTPSAGLGGCLIKSLLGTCTLD